MSTEFIEKYCSRHFQKYPKKSKEEILDSLTHLYLNGRKLEEIGEIACKRLKVIYLHNNSIRQINNLDQPIHLTHLYLQWNRIAKIEGLNRLRNLRKLYLGYNVITCLEGIDRLHNLEELHLESQKLQLNDEFTFDFNSLAGIAKSLRVLNVSRLSLTRLSFLKPLLSLEELIATDNLFNDATDLAESIRHCKALRSVHFKGCPAHVNDIYYRNKITIRSDSLVLLDGKQIPSVTRAFLKSFVKVKMEQRQKRKKETVDEVSRSVEIDLSLSQSDHTAFNLSNIIADAMVESTEYKPWSLFKPKSPKLSQISPKASSPSDQPDHVLSVVSVVGVDFVRTKEIIQESGPTVDDG